MAHVERQQLQQRQQHIKMAVAVAVTVAVTVAVVMAISKHHVIPKPCHVLFQFRVCKFLPQTKKENKTTTTTTSATATAITQN